MKKRNKKIIAITLLSVFLLSVCICFYLLFKNKTTIIEEESITENDTAEVFQPYRDTWLDNKRKNKDYVGQIVFDSGLINKPFVQATSCYKSDGTPYHFYDMYGNVVTDFTDLSGNDVYIWMNWEDGTYDYDINGGSIFLDCSHLLDGNNLTIYGHYFSTIYNKDPERIKAFTPLEKFFEEENYEDNKYMSIVLDNETRHYVLAAVLIFDSKSDEYMEKCQYWRNDFNYFYDTDQFDYGYNSQMIQFINNNKLYETGIELAEGDRTVCLQTCMTPRMTDYEVCIFKEIGVDNYQ